MDSWQQQLARRTSRRLKIFPSVLSAVIAASFALQPVMLARDWFAAPAPSGEKDGTSAQNAAGPDALQGILDQLKPGDRLMLAGGEYADLKLTLRASGNADQPITVGSQDDNAGHAIFASKWTIAAPTKGSTAFTIEPGVSHIVFRDITIRGYQHGVQAPGKEGSEPRVGLRFENVDMEQIRHGFYLSSCSDLTLIDCDLKRYSKHGFRFEAACSNVTLQKCVADCSEADPEWEKQTELFPFGFVVNDGGAPNTNFVFEDCISRNNMMPLQTTRYKNGDGFVVEGNSQNVSFKRCIAANNQDGGFDLKVKDVHLEDCVAIRNKRDYRIWTTGNLHNCFAGWSILGIWTKGGPIVAEHCTIAGWKENPAQAEDTKIGTELRHCLLAADGNPSNAEKLKAVSLIDSVEAADLASAGLQRPPNNWNGDTSILPSTTHRNKGFQVIHE